MKKNNFNATANSFKPKPLVLAVRHALPYLIVLGLGSAAISPALGRSGDSAAAFTATQLIRQFTLKNTVAQVSQGMQGYVGEVNGVLRAEAMGPTPTGYPADMGSVPTAANLPQRDGAGRPLGYCAWDNNSSTSNSSFIAGQGVGNPLLYAVVSPGLNGSLETSCAYILANRLGVGDDHVQVTAPSQASSRQFRSSVGTYANLLAMPGEEGDIRLVLESNELYSYVGGAWQAVGSDKFVDDSVINGAGAIAYTTGKVTVADFQAASATIAGTLSGSSATFSSSVTANNFVGNGAGLVDLNASNISSGVLGAAFGGTGVDSSAAAQGSLLIGTGAGFALGTISAGDGIGVLNGAGSITISNTGVLSISGTGNQIIASGMNGDVVLSLPQDIATISTPTFAGMVLNGALTGTTGTFTGNVDLSSLSIQGIPATVAFSYASDTGSPSYAEPNLGLGAGALASRKSAGNVAIGEGVLSQMTTLGYGVESGTWNTGVGYQALYTNDYGDENTALGYKSLYSNTSGYYNTASGAWSLYSNTIGNLNTANGYYSLRANTSGFYNVAVGAYSLAGNTTGYLNASVGHYALRSNTTGLYNTAIGSYAGSSISTSAYVTSIGAYSMRSSTGGESVAIGTNSLYRSEGLYNVAVGNNTFFELRAGSSNTSLGHYSMPALITGSTNIAIGHRSGNTITTGNRNILIGDFAANGTSTSTNNIAIGHEISVGDGLNHAMAIGNNSSVTTSNTLVLGRTTDNTVIGATGDDGSGNKLQVTGGMRASGNVILNTDSAANYTQLRDLRVMSSGDNAGWDHLRIRANFATTTIDAGGAENGLIFRVGQGASGGVGDQTYNTVLTLKPDQSAVFAGRVDVQSLYVNGAQVAAVNKANIDTALTVASSVGAAFPQSNLALGATSLDAAARAGNIAIGEGVLGNLFASAVDSEGIFNTGVGYNALYLNSTGSRNVALGVNTLYNNTTGSKNSALGTNTLLYNTIGTENAALGYNALLLNTSGGYNTALGSESLLLSTTGSYNTGVGRYTLGNTTTGTNNVAVGNESGLANVSGSNNTVVGSGANLGASNLTHGTALGSGALVSTNDTVALGRSGTTDQIVIGTASRNNTVPNTIFHVAGVSNFSSTLHATGGAQVSTSQLLRFGGVAEGTDNVGIDRINPATDQSVSRIGIGDNIESFGGTNVDELQVGNLFLDGSFAPRFRVAGNGDVIASGYMQATVFNATSDRRLKTNIQVQDSSSVLSRLEQLQTYTYRYLANPDLGNRIGVIAQEIQNLFPETVSTRADGMMSVDYSALGAMAAMGVGQLSKQVKVLDTTVAEHGRRISALDDRVTQHDTRIASLESWKTEAGKRMDGMQSAIDLNIQKIAANTVAIQTNTSAIERLDDALFSLDGQVKNNTDLINNINARWARNFSESADGSLLTVNAVELKLSNLTAQQMRAGSVYSQRLEAEMARIADLEVNNLRANSAVANTVQAEQVNTGSVQVYAGVGLPAVLFAAKSDGHYTVSTSALDGSYATATVIVNAGQAKVISVASEGIELYAEGNQVKVIAAGKSVKASWIKMG